MLRRRIKRMNVVDIVLIEIFVVLARHFCPLSRSHTGFRVSRSVKFAVVSLPCIRFIFVVWANGIGFIQKYIMRGNYNPHKWKSRNSVSCGFLRQSLKAVGRPFGHTKAKRSFAPIVIASRRRGNLNEKPLTGVIWKPCFRDMFFLRKCDICLTASDMQTYGFVNCKAMPCVMAKLGNNLQFHPHVILSAGKAVAEESH